MRQTDFEFNGKTWALSFTAEALFRIYDKFGVNDNIVEATKIFEPTEEGFTNLCWLTALLAAQGELQRRLLGEDPREMLTLEQIRTGLPAGDVPRLYNTVRACLEQGFAHEAREDAAEKEVNLVLQAREDAAKKSLLLARSALDTLRQQLKSLVSGSGTPSS